jgi:hypothetical protein
MNRFEDELQMQCVQWMDLAYPKLSSYFYAISNGWNRTSKLLGWKFKRMGIRRGIPDLCLAIPTEKYHGLYIELKFGKGVLSDHQKYMKSLLEKVGYKVITCWTIDEFMKEIKFYLEDGKNAFNSSLPSSGLPFDSSAHNNKN